MTKRKNTTKTPKAQLTPVQRFNPPSEGKFTAFDRITKDHAAFLDGQYLGHRPTRDEAEALIREVYYAQLTHFQSENYDVEQEVVEAVAEALADLPLVIARPDICDDTLDPEHFGKQMGVEFVAGVDKNGFETHVYLPIIATSPLDVPQISFLGQDGVPIEDFLKIYDQITALLNDPRVQAGCERFKRAQGGGDLGSLPKPVDAVTIEQADDALSLSSDSVEIIFTEGRDSVDDASLVLDGTLLSLTPNEARALHTLIQTPHVSRWAGLRKAVTD